MIFRLSIQNKIHTTLTTNQKSSATFSRYFLPKYQFGPPKIVKFWFSKSFRIENEFLVLKKYQTRPFSSLTLIFKVVYFLKTCPIFVCSVDNFVRDRKKLTYLYLKFYSSLNAQPKNQILNGLLYCCILHYADGIQQNISMHCNGKKQQL